MDSPSPAHVESLKAQSPLIANSFPDDALLVRVVQSVRAGKTIYPTYLAVRGVGCSVQYAYNLVEEIRYRLRKIEVAALAPPQLLASLKSQSSLIAAGFLNDDLLADVVCSLRSTGKLQAMKQIREATRCKLREAFTLVEEVDRVLRRDGRPAQVHPELDKNLVEEVEHARKKTPVPM